ncbi:MAG: hypothetical protein ACI81R_000118 [Bradymonadia bacterium]|jgi:hypothetical protein
MKMFTQMLSTILLTSVFAAVGAPLAWSQDRDGNTGIIVFDDAEIIRGEIEKPEAYYILSPSNLNYESLDAEETFLDRLYETVEEPAF